MYFFNSLVVATITTIGQVIFAALAGYAFARLNFKYKNALFLLILITMLIPPQVNIIPLFFLMRELHLIDTYQALILPALFGGFCRAALAESYGNIDLRITAQNGERYGVADFELADSDVKSVGA